MFYNCNLESIPVKNTESKKQLLNTIFNVFIESKYSN